MPIGADLVLHEQGDPERVRRNGIELGRAIEHAACRWNSPLAIPLMDLRLEKIDLLALLGVGEKEAEAFHLSELLPEPALEDVLAQLSSKENPHLCPESRARDEAVTFIHTQTDLVPVGMTIGPFSLATRLLADPIPAIAMEGSQPEPPEVLLLKECLRMAEAAVVASIHRQIRHGARAMMVCEPAACIAYLSPRHFRAGSPAFARFVMEPNLRLKADLDRAGCDLIFHNCGELIDPMVQAFAYQLHPVVLSLGSSRRLWEDARLVPEDVVLYGNLPSKLFYSDTDMPVSEVQRRTEELIGKMKRCGHPHIVGTECDVLFVPGAEATIQAKVDAMMNAGLCDTMDAWMNGSTRG